MKFNFLKFKIAVDFGLLAKRALSHGYRVGSITYKTHFDREEVSLIPIRKFSTIANDAIPFKRGNKHSLKFKDTISNGVPFKDMKIQYAFPFSDTRQYSDSVFGIDSFYIEPFSEQNGLE